MLKYAKRSGKADITAGCSRGRDSGEHVLTICRMSAQKQRVNVVVEGTGGGTTTRSTQEFEIGTIHHLWYENYWERPEGKLEVRISNTVTIG